MKLKVLVHPEEVGGFSVSVPAFPGCFSQGETLDEALVNIREAAELWIESACEIAEIDAREQRQAAQLQEIEL